jgi:hypothetical protein
VIRGFALCRPTRTRRISGSLSVVLADTRETNPGKSKKIRGGLSIAVPVDEDGGKAPSASRVTIEVIPVRDATRPRSAGPVAA